MWGLVPAAGLGSRIQPLAFSKELLPVGSRWEEGVERPRAVSEYLLDRMIEGGATRLCFVVSPGKSDILEYYGGSFRSVPISYVMQPRPCGLCDALFRGLPFFAPAETVLVGLPDTLWFPEHGFRTLPADPPLSFLLFPVSHPQRFDAVITDEEGQVVEIQVKQDRPRSSWVWGAFKVRSEVLGDLYRLWCERQGRDEYVGTLVNEYLARGGRAVGVCAGESYVDVGTFDGYRQAMQLLGAGPALVGSRP